MGLVLLHPPRDDNYGRVATDSFSSWVIIVLVIVAVLIVIGGGTATYFCWREGQRRGRAQRDAEIYAAPWWFAWRGQQQQQQQPGAGPGVPLEPQNRELSGYYTPTPPAGAMQGPGVNSPDVRGFYEPPAQVHAPGPGQRVS